MNKKNQKDKSLFIKQILRNPKSRIGLIVTMIGYTGVLFGLGFGPNLENFDTNTLLFKILPIAVTVLGVGYLFIGYLEGNKPKTSNSDNKNSSSSNIHSNFNNELQIELERYFDELRLRQERSKYETRELIESFRQQVNEKNQLQLDENQREEVFKYLKKSFQENLNENFFSELNENISIELTQEKKQRFDFLTKEFHQTKRRLRDEIETLGRKANLNLVIGSITTIIALIGLGILVFDADNTFTDYKDALYHYVPRLSLIIFIEVFAYFFLKLYKLNLNDIKYFQNELTTVELRFSSIVTAINFGKDIDITAVTQQLSKTERNFILQKGETTVDLEKTKNANNETKDVLKLVSDIIKNKN